ncbi:MAG: DUF4199 domain-containing protein [Tidjanibacter sp.]|nr:DUF4199 domain-containing protein [Tidjanibacter sp.]
MTKKQYWYEALVGGTVVGLVSVAFSIVLQLLGGNSQDVAEPSFLVKAINFVSVFLTVVLLFGYTRRFAAQHSLEEGFSVGRAVGFVVSMMLFAGVISGIYSAVMANFFIKEEILQSVDAVMAQMQDLYSADQFDSLYSTMQKAVVNPIYLTISSVISNCFTGVIVGLLVGLLTRRRPDIFADVRNNEGDSTNIQQ